MKMLDETRPMPKYAKAVTRAPLRLNDSIRVVYGEMWGACEIEPWAVEPAANWARRIMQHISQYGDASDALGISWQFTAVVHMMEADLNFTRHLHNGDSLARKTVHVPSGRPVAGTPPYTWAYSAKDALTYMGLDKWTDWSVVGMMYQLEAYNGFGYRSHGVCTPYLWCGSTHYKRGKYVQDGKFDPHAVSRDVGCAPVLKALGVEMP